MSDSPAELSSAPAKLKAGSLHWLQVAALGIAIRDLRQRLGLELWARCRGLGRNAARRARDGRAVPVPDAKSG